MLVDRVIIKKGQVAPFNGQLLSDAAVASLLSGYNEKIRLLNLEIENSKKQNKVSEEYIQKMCDVKINSEKDKCSAAEVSCNTKLEIYKSTLLNGVEQCKNPWYMNPYLGFSLGVGSCFLLNKIN